MKFFFLTLLLLSVVYSMFSISRILNQTRLQQQQGVQIKNANSNSSSSTAKNTIAPGFDDQGNAIFNETKLHQYMLNQRRTLLNASTIMNLGQHKFAPMPSEFFHDFFKDILFLKSWIEINKANETTRLEYLKNYTDPTSSDVVHSIGVCDAIHIFKATNSTKKHILIAAINENWGAFSSPVPNRTVDWGEWREHFEKGCTMDDLWYYLNHTNLGAIFTTTHQWLDHPKIFSIPLGVKRHNIDVIVESNKLPVPNKTELLFLSIAPSQTRLPIANRIIANFNGTIKNKFRDGSNYFEEMRKAKFVLCPSGMGWDTYRAWESLMMGSIPVLETFSRKDGFYKTFDDLPVLWIEHYDNVTPALLEREYPRVLAKAYEYNFEKLTNKWWVELIQKYRT